MRKNARAIQAITVLAVMTAFLFDITTAKNGASEGLQMCIQSVIPSLFPFIFLSLLLTSRLYGTPISVLKAFSKLGYVPKGGESILLMAFLGGYPVGAQTVYNAWADGTLDKESANRLLGFCNNAGPSFIFGILHTAFDNKVVLWALWAVHICSALIVGWILPGRNTCSQKIKTTPPLSVTYALKKATMAMAGICGWIIMIRTFLAFATKYLLKNTAPLIQVLVSGGIELTNGCLLLPMIADEPTRFIAAACLLSSGGLCVYLQTRAVTGNLGTGMYLPGKFLQTLVSLILSGLCVPVLFPSAYSYTYLILSATGSILVFLILQSIKKSCSNLEKPVV